MDTKQLLQLGLSEKEANAYLELIRKREATVSELSKRIQINRTVLYYVLEGLVQKGLASYIIKNNLRVYHPAEPDKLLSILKEKEKIATAIIPELAKLYSPESKKPIIEIFEGKDGLKTILNDIIKQKKDWFASDSPGRGKEVMGATSPQFEKIRQQEKIHLKVIFVNTQNGLKTAKEFAQMKHTEVRVNPEPFESAASNWIYADRVVTVFWKMPNLFTLRIINQELADSYRNSFMLRWKFLEKNKVLP